MELTKEYFDQQLKTINNRMDGLATKEDLAKQTQELKAYAREQTEELAQVIATSVDVSTRVQNLEQAVSRKFGKLEEALHIKL